MKIRRKYLYLGTESEIVLDQKKAGDGVTYVGTIDGSEYEIQIENSDAHTARIGVGARTVTAYLSRRDGVTQVFVRGRVYRLEGIEGTRASATKSVGSPEIRSPMPGKILQILVSDGQVVEAGDDLVILEAMKMENRLRAEVSGRVASIEVGEGDRVDDGQLLIRLAPASQH